MARKRDTPEYISRMQMEIFEKMGGARSIEELRRIEPQVLRMVNRYYRELQGANPSDTVIRRRISKLNYEKRCFQASAIQAFRRKGVKVSPGMTVGYVVRDATRWEVDTEWDASEFDLDYYGKLIGKAWDDAAFVFNSLEEDVARGTQSEYFRATMFRLFYDVLQRMFCKAWIIALNLVLTPSTRHPSTEEKLDSHIIPLGLDFTRQLPKIVNTSQFRECHDRYVAPHSMCDFR